MLPFAVKGKAPAAKVSLAPKLALGKGLRRYLLHRYLVNFQVDGSLIEALITCGAEKKQSVTSVLPYA